MVMNNLNNLMPGVPVDPMEQRQQMINTGRFSPQAQQVANGVFQPEAFRNQSVAYVNPTMQSAMAGQVDPMTGMSLVNPNQVA